MTVNDLIAATGWQPLTDAPDHSIGSVYVCDLLSWAMARVQTGTVWITVQTHLNVIAVASLTGCACVVIPEGIMVSEETLGTARKKGVRILSASSTSYGAAAKLMALGIGEVEQ